MKPALAMAAVLSMSIAATGATMNLTCGGLHTVVASPGYTLAVTLTVDTSVAIASWAGQLSASRSFVLTVSGWTEWPPPLFPPFEPYPNGPLNPTSEPFSHLSFSNLGPGTVPLSTFNLEIASSWDGVPVQLTVINPLLSDSAGAPVFVNVAPLNIIPEPGALLLLGLGGLWLRRRTAGGPKPFPTP